MSALHHLVHQGPVLRALGGVALSSFGSRTQAAPPVLPGPWIEEEVAARPEALVRDYVRHVGGDPAWYRGVVPAHLFPQWSFPLLAKAVASLPYPATRVVNAGCRLEMRAPLPAGESLRVKVRIEAIDVDDRRALLTQRIVTGTSKVPQAVVAELRAMVPLAKREPGGASKSRPTVPAGARELAFLRLGPESARDFAALTGDVNPIHWFAPAARAAGFRGCILHGFSTMARAIEAMNRRVFAGDVRMLGAVDVRFTKPLVLPAKVGVYVTGDDVLVGDAPGGAAYLEGKYEVRNHG